MPTTMQRLRVVPLLAYAKAVPPLSVSVGDRKLDISTPSWSARAIAYWRPHWKTQLIGRFLERRVGLFVDVGANIGQTLLDYLACSSRHGYLGFEPSPEAASNVARIIEANGLDDCEIVPVALSNEPGLTPLFQSGASDTCATMVEGFRPRAPVSARTIATLRFDDLEVGPIALIKIDVEGAELAVMQGMRNSLKNSGVPVLCEILRRDRAAEPGPYKERVMELQQLISDVGLRAYVIRKSADLSRVLALELVDTFPLEVFSEETRELNDYLLCPAAAKPNFS